MTSVPNYRVQRGDTLTEIAHRHGVDPEALMRANGLDPALADGHVSRQARDPDRLQVGQRLTIPSATAGLERQHSVAPGETLAGIAERWGVALVVADRGQPAVPVIARALRPPRRYAGPRRGPRQRSSRPGRHARPAPVHRPYPGLSRSGGHRHRQRRRHAPARWRLHRGLWRPCRPWQCRPQPRLLLVPAHRQQPGRRRPPPAADPARPAARL